MICNIKLKMRDRTLVVRKKMLAALFWKEDSNTLIFKKKENGRQESDVLAKKEISACDRKTHDRDDDRARDRHRLFGERPDSDGRPPIRRHHPDNALSSRRAPGA